MSGGSYDYTYHKVEMFVDQLDERTPERRRFKALLEKVARAMHDIEWVDSGDYGDGDENAAILACFTEAGNGR